MNRIVLILSAIVAMSAMTCFAGFDQYTGKNYTTLLAPTPLGVTQTGATTNMVEIGGAVTNVMNVVASVPVVSNSFGNVVSFAGKVGRGAIVFSLDPGVAGGVLTATLWTSATTNGTYALYTNDQGESSWAVTNTEAFKVIPVRPNNASKYWRAQIVASTGCTNASASAVLVTE